MPGWANLTAQSSNVSIDRAFQYQTSDQLDSDLIVGNHHTYSAGGYVYDFRGRLSDLQSNLSQLHQLSWIDDQTRAVLVQLTLYNPNVQLFTSVKLLAEFLPTGGVVTQSSFRPISFQRNSLFPHLSPSFCVRCSVHVDLSFGGKHLVSGVHRLHDDGGSTVADSTEESVFPSVLVVHRRGHHRLLVDQRGHLHVALPRAESCR